MVIFGNVVCSIVFCTKYYTIVLGDIMEKEKILQDFEYDLICDFIKLRKEKGLTQAELGRISGVLREKIAKIENHLNSPQLNSLFEILVPIGYTLKIVQIKE